MRIRVLAVVLASVMMLGCVSSKDQEVDSNTKVISGQQIVDLLAGNSVIGPDLAIYYDENGRKVTRTPNGTAVHKWWLADGKHYGETVDDEVTQMCGITFNLQSEGGNRYRVFRGDGRFLADVEVVEGNPEGL